ncbi:MAG: response regulator [Gammaproteobacteria bacterium]
MDKDAHKSALIVDDSRTAREALARVLRQHQIAVEMAESAEEALEVLVRARPDVIFMDHLMPGMDGFQAVRAIKDNPATATIPIMMYTSQAGELYVGQARALGAIGVLPKQIKPVQVSETLKSLNLLPRAQDPQEVVENRVEPESEVQQTLADVEDMMEPADWSELHRWFAQMLEHHGHTMRADIEASVARLLKANVDEQDPTGEHRVPGHGDVPHTQLSRMNTTTLLVAALAVFAALFFWLYVEKQRDWRDVYAQNVELLEVLQAQQAEAEAVGVDARLGGRPPMGRTGSERIVPELEWAANQFASYGAAEVPLSDQRLDLIESLVRQLRSVGFQGEVQIDTHVGDFCYVQGAEGVLEFAPEELPVADCDRIGLDEEEARAVSAKQSVAFANYLAAFEREAERDVRISVNAHGNSSPQYSYPARSADNTAGAWNEVARQNNRVQVRLVADTASPPGDFGRSGRR